MTLPVKKDESFYAPAEKMDFSAIRGCVFAVAVSSGDRDSGKGLMTTLHGPYDFSEMIEVIGELWRDQLLHGKAYILNKDFDKKVRWLDRNTVDYIEQHWEDMIAEIFIDNLFTGDQDFTCQAGIEEAKEEDIPKANK
jgi:hypothetical protein